MRGDKQINIKFIDAKYQRYPTCGDYWETEDTIEIRITKQKDLRYNLLILLHEMIEYILTERAGIKEEDILEYDKIWNKKVYTAAEEPGDEKDCPYRKQHRTAENFERLLADYLDVDWKKYGDELI